MPTQTSISPKPRSEVLRHSITRLAPLTWWRRRFRRLVHLLSRLLVYLWTIPTVSGLEHIPEKGPALLVSNHLGDADLILGFAYAPQIVEPFAKIELMDIPLLGWILDAYGVIWVRRGQPDRRALRVVMEAMKQGRMVGIAPEARESLTGSLEEGTGGAAYIALKGDLNIIPITLTGTENSRIFHNMKRLRKTEVSVKVGAPFKLEQFPDLREGISAGTEKIMRILARQLPPEYRGFYNY